MRLHFLTRSRLRPVYPVVAALVAAAAAMPFLIPVSKAHAESGRRVCRYVWNQSVGNPERRYVSLVVDYKKDGACPNIDPHKVTLPPAVGAWMPPPDTWEHAPVPKMTCEQFGALLDLSSSGYGDDPCTYMWNDELYAVTSSMPDDTGHTRRFWDLGSVWNLRY